MVLILNLPEKPQNNALNCPPLVGTCPKMRKNADAFDADQVQGNYLMHINHEPSKPDKNKLK